MSKRPARAEAPPPGPSLGALEQLLEAFSPDRTEAENRYHLLRRKLITFLELRGAYMPEDLADEVLSIVACKIDKGFRLRPGDPYAYFCGVAHILLKAQSRERAAEFRVRNDWEREHRGLEVDQHDDVFQQRLKCLNCCLAKLPDDSRRMILAYYMGQGKDRIERRTRLAEELGIPINALRIRVWRIREKLQQCVRKCLDS